MKTFEISGKDVLLWRKKLLLKGGRSVDLDWLLDICGGLRWSTLQKLHVDPSRSLLLDQSLDHLAKLWKQHLDGQIPLQHLVGRCPWRDFELDVSPFALIPRQETEILLDLALKKVDSKFSGLWADLGTGSGAIAIALARSLPVAIGHAVDCCEDALSLARGNIKHLAPNAKVSFHLGSWWEPLRPWWGSLSLVLANPPYIPTAVLNNLEPIVRDNEPHLALCGGLDGLNACRDIVRGSREAMSQGGWLMLEHHYDQSFAVLDLMKDAGLKDIEYQNDLNGIRRFAIGRQP